MNWLLANWARIMAGLLFTQIIALSMKVFGGIAWSWWLVLVPAWIIAVMLLFAAVVTFILLKAMKNWN